MYIGKREFVRIVTYLIAAILMVGVYAAQEYNSAENLKRSMQYEMSRNVEDLSGSLDNISITLTKGIYAGTPHQLSNLSSKLWSDASNAKISLSQLPVAELHLENTYKFLSQVGNFSKSLADKYSSGENLSEEDRQKLVKLSEYAKTLSENMWSVEQRVNSGELSFEKIKTGIWDTENENDPGYITEGFTDFEEGYDNYPVLIYDGPFSDHIMEKQPEMLKGESIVTPETARKTAVKATGDSTIMHTDLADEGGKMPCYVFTGDTTTAITKAGGYLCYMLGHRQVNVSNISCEKATEIAEDFLAKMGYSDMEDTYYEVQSNICTINFAYETRGIICYTDLIKVSVALDNGEVLSCDARGYLTNHRDRVVTTPEISKSDAASVVADNLTIEDTELCIIPSGGLNELYCYEFKCRTEEGNTVLVYINADTGTEEQILLLTIGEYGTLTV